MHAAVIKKYVQALFLAFSICGVVGCSTVTPAVDPEVVDAITHIGRLESRAGGYVAVTNLVSYGDHGVGAFEGQEGQLIMYSGTVFRSSADYQLAPVSEFGEVPYAVVTWFEADRMFDVGAMKGKMFERALDLRRRYHVPQAIRVEGYFKHVTLVAGEANKTIKDMVGALVGFYYPDEASGYHAKGYHFYFISEDLRLGGQVSNFEIGKARISIDQSPYLHAILPMRYVEPAINLPVNPAALR